MGVVATGLGSDIDTAPRLTQTIRDLQTHDEAEARDHKLIMIKLAAMDWAIQDHVAWEMSQKYQGTSD